MTRFVMVDNTIIENKEISSNDKIVYIYLISLYNKEKCYSFPSLKNISEHIGISLSTVKRSIKHLSELGFITVEKRKAKIGNYNLYKKLKHLISPKKES